MRIWTQLQNVPYSDSFNPEENYTAISLPMQTLNGQPCDKIAHKVAYRVTLQVVFSKSVSFFKSKIEKASSEKGVESFKNYTDWAQIKIEDYRLNNPVSKFLVPDAS